MNRLKQLRQEKHFTPMELVESIRHISPTMTVKDWLVYENDGIKRHNDKFWQNIADYFEVDLGYLYGYSKIPNENYIIDLQDLIQKNLDLKIENSVKDMKIEKLEKENKILVSALKKVSEMLVEMLIKEVKKCMK